MQIIQYSPIRIIDNVATGHSARLYRKEKELSIQQVSQRMGISAAFLSDLELGRRAWREDLAKRFVESFNEKEKP